MSSEVVSVFRGPAGEARAVAAMLLAAGVAAVVSADDVGGWRPDVGFVQGTRVLVARQEEALARSLIEGAEPPSP